MKEKLLRGPMGFALCFLGCAAAVWAAAAGVLLSMPLVLSARFLLFQLLCVVLPGLALQKLFALNTTPLQTLVFSYGFGFSAPSSSTSQLVVGGGFEELTIDVVLEVLDAE